MNVVFSDDALEELYRSGATKDSKYKKLSRDRRFMEAYVQVVNIMLSAPTANDLRTYSYLHYEQLRHRPESSVRIMNGRVERLLFTEHDGGIEVKLIEINKDHYGNKR